MDRNEYIAEMRRNGWPEDWLGESSIRIAEARANNLYGGDFAPLVTKYFDPLTGIGAPTEEDQEELDYLISSGKLAAFREATKEWEGVDEWGY